MNPPVLQQYLVGLGSNLGNSRQTLTDAAVLIERRVGPIIAHAPLYESAPQGGVADRTFLNSALICQTNLLPDEAMLRLLEIEDYLGRQRLRRWDNRTIDLDILMGMTLPSKIIIHQSPRTTIPHPRFLERDFALIPAALLVPDWIHPFSKQSLKKEATRIPSHLKLVTRYNRLQQQAAALSELI